MEQNIISEKRADSELNHPAAVGNKLTGTGTSPAHAIARRGSGVRTRELETQVRSLGAGGDAQHRRLALRAHHSLARGRGQGQRRGSRGRACQGAEASDKTEGRREAVKAWVSMRTAAAVALSTALSVDRRFCLFHAIPAPWAQSTALKETSAETNT